MTAALVAGEYLTFPIFITPMNMASRSNERNADKFACNLGDDAVLRGGISFFEDEDMDPLFNVENKTVSPYIKIDNRFATALQAWAHYNEQDQLNHLRFIKSISFLRAMYEYMSVSSHPYPSWRVQAIQAELDRRAQEQEQTQEQQA